ncbi:uncharacterized protein [Palaemon carinicauda]|uniref:uncharacterized protein n=1 Tax=Palaemon carinicauda TaxID=392227 RepID=UPI0035B622B0
MNIRYYLLVIIRLFLLRRTSANFNIVYKQMFRNLYLTLPGAYSSHNECTKITCAMFCSQSNCDGFAYDAAANVCKIYHGLYTFLVPATTTIGTLMTFVPVDSPIIFIKLLPGYWSWNSAQAECRNHEGNLIPMPTKAEEDRLHSIYGEFFIGVYKTSQGSTTYYDYYGNELQQSEIRWDTNQPNNRAQTGLTEFCLGRLAVAIHDLYCESHDTIRRAICAVYAN